MEAATLEGRLWLILGPLLPFLSALQVPETSFLAPLTFRTHLISVLPLAVLSAWEGTVALPSPVGQGALVDRHPSACTTAPDGGLCVAQPPLPREPGGGQPRLCEVAAVPSPRTPHPHLHCRHGPSLLTFSFSESFLVCILQQSVLVPLKTIK